MVFEKVVSIVAAHKELDPAGITAETRFSDLKLDSLDMVELVMTLEEAFDVNIEMADGLQTVGDVVAVIEGLKDHD